MTSGFRTIIYPVKDLAKAKALYRALLGVAPESRVAPRGWR
jgi:catechol 2,3-dioxygenase-like lactoylglutathione lyase family enzyme